MFDLRLQDNPFKPLVMEMLHVHFTNFIDPCEESQNPRTNWSSVYLSYLALLFIYFLPMLSHTMVADGSVGSGFGVIGFPVACLGSVTLLACFEFFLWYVIVHEKSGILSFFEKIRFQQNW